MATTIGDRYLDTQPKIRSPPTPIRQFKDRKIHNSPINGRRIVHGDNDKPKVKVANVKVKTAENTGSRIPTKVQTKQTRKISNTATKSNEKKEITTTNNLHLLENQGITLNQPRLNSTKAIGDTLKRLENANAPSIRLTDDIKASINGKASHVLNIARNQQRYQSLLPLEVDDSAPVAKIVAPTKPKYIKQIAEPVTHIEDYLPDDYYTEVSPFDVNPEESTLNLETEPISSAFDFYREMQRWR